MNNLYIISISNTYTILGILVELLSKSFEIAGSKKFEKQ